MPSGTTIDSAAHNRGILGGKATIRATAKRMKNLRSSSSEIQPESPGPSDVTFLLFNVLAKARPDDEMIDRHRNRSGALPTSEPCRA